MKNDEFLKLCKNTIVDYFNNRTDKKDKFEISEEDVFIVWSCKTLQNNKALVSTTISDGMYYELTYNGDKKELYLDAYKKWENKCIKVEEEKIMTFGEALDQLKQGKKISREGWNGKNQYLGIANNISFLDFNGNVENANHETMGNKAIVFYGTSGIQVGWLASQSDMLSEDWRVVD